MQNLREALESALRRFCSRKIFKHTASDVIQEVIKIARVLLRFFSCYANLIAVQCMTIDRRRANGAANAPYVRILWLLSENPFGKRISRGTIEIHTRVFEIHTSVFEIPGRHRPINLSVSSSIQAPYPCDTSSICTMTICGTL